MDPATVIAMVGSGLTIATKTLKTLNEICDKLKNVGQNVQLIVAKLSSIRAALIQLQILVKDGSTMRFMTPQLRADLVSAINPCTIVMKGIEQHISLVNKGWFNGKARYFWDEGIINEQSGHLDSQVQALSLLLQVIQLSSANEQRTLLERRVSRRILRRAQDDASSYLSRTTGDSSRTIQETVSFEFDEELMGSRTYRAASQDRNGRQPQIRDSIPDIMNSPEPEVGLETIEGTSTPDQLSSNFVKSELVLLPQKGRYPDFLKSKQATGTNSDRKRRRLFLFWLGGGTLILFVITAALLTTLDQKHGRPTDSPGSQVFNSMEFPYIPLGVSAVLDPVLAEVVTGCAFPSTLWSCAVPRSDQSSLLPNSPDRPNFQFEIFTNTTSFTPNPAPPNSAEQTFLGNTTDSIAAPLFAGEETPLYISFTPAQNNKARKRDGSEQNEAATGPFPNITSLIPAPSLNSNGGAADANLLPLPTYQPLRLYNRGLETEHYGFYTYFDRSIFTSNITGSDSDDTPGGASINDAKFRSTWAQTRFLVQIWTRAQNNISTPVAVSGSTELRNFTYPMSITLDRHGGDPDQKTLYSYSLQDNGSYVDGSGMIIEELRDFDGTIINPASTIFSNGSDPSLGGIDGGTGGCKCLWQYY
ncbi:hypothetical protein N431DRAFT_455978 [Stipitochalara longipes BDJ]|nr:hypothetical protein N431DRAFT_455978 [Stipitochalara longipes BDJ]